MADGENIKLLRICLKDEDDKVYCILKKVNKDTTLKDIRDMNEKKKIGSDIEEDYSVSDIMDDNNRIYIKKKPIKNEDSAPVLDDKNQTNISQNVITPSEDKEISNKNELAIKEKKI